MSVCITITTPSGIVAASDSRSVRNLKNRGETNYSDDNEKIAILNDMIITHTGNAMLNNYSDLDIDVFLEAVKEKYKDKTISIHKWPELIIKEWKNAIEHDYYRIYRYKKSCAMTEESATYFTIAGYSTRKAEKGIPFVYQVDTFKGEAEQIGPRSEINIYVIVMNGGEERFNEFIKMNKKPFNYSLDQAINYVRFVVNTYIENEKFNRSTKQIIGGTCHVYAIDKIHGIAGMVDENNNIIPDPLVKTAKRTIL